MTRLVRRLAGLILRLLRVDRVRFGRGLAEEAVRQWEQAPDARAALREALRFHGDFYRALGRLAIRAEGGVHPKHRLMRFHDFFTERIAPGESVLDVGCEHGALTRDLAAVTDRPVTGLERDFRHVARARELGGPPNLEYVCADASDWRPDRTYDVIVLSNVLEHIDDRLGLLKRLTRPAQPKRFLIRVPMLERDWLTPLKAELGLDSRLDPDHSVEHTEAALREELAAAGLRITELRARFGEFYCVAEPQEAEA